MWADVLPKLGLHYAPLELEMRRTAGRIRVRAHQLMCAATGHDYFIRTRKGRIFLRCDDCAHETPGWQIDVKR
jgi:hypothetical protein